MAVTISLCMIVKNEEKTLCHCLDSVYDLFDEVIIVDTGSTDKTVEIAKKYTSNIFYFEWVNDFAAARNFSFSKATMDYIMWLDADDIMTSADRLKLKELKENLAEMDMDVVIMDYRYEKGADGSTLTLQKRERIVKRSKNFKWKGRLHETLDIHRQDPANVYVSDIAIDHEYHLYHDDKAWVKRNLKVLEQVIGTGEETPRDLAHYGLTLNSDGQNDKALIYLEKYLESKDALTFAQSGDIAVYKALHEIYLEKNEIEKAFLLLDNSKEILGHLSEYYCILGDFANNIFEDFESAVYYYSRALTCEYSDFQAGATIAYKPYYYFIPLSSLGMVYLKAGEIEEAIEYYKKALEFAEENNSTSSVTQLIEKLEQLKNNCET